MRAVVVGQAFKGSLSAADVARALADGVAAAGLTPHIIVGSDGGDGLLDAAAPARRASCTVTDPLGRSVEAVYGWLDARTAVIESRLACGVALLGRGERDPTITTTRGVGELIVAAAREGATTVVVGLGGSATMDGGLGAARAWGWRALDAAGRDLPEGGGALAQLETLLPGPGPGVRLLGLADVRNRLLGAHGAAVYAPQKGATPEMVAALTAALGRLATVARPWNGPALADHPGAGAAGGLGFGLVCFGGATLEPGAAWVLERAAFDEALGDAVLVVIAEATLDATSFAGKLTGEVVERAGRRGVPVALVTPRPRITPRGVTVVSRPGRWRTADVARIAERAVRRALRLPPG